MSASKHLTVKYRYIGTPIQILAHCWASDGRLLAGDVTALTARLQNIAGLESVTQLLPGQVVLLIKYNYKWSEVFPEIQLALLSAYEDSYDDFKIEIDPNLPPMLEFKDLLTPGRSDA